MRSYFHCKDCPRRTPGCHDRCTDYAMALQLLHEEKARRARFLGGLKQGCGTNGRRYGQKR